MPILNINTDAVVQFTNTLENLHRSALPSAIRNTLNDAAFDVKTNTMPSMADETFEKRSPNFFKANSKFEKASGFDVNTMKSTVGFVESGLKGGDNYSVKDLEQQEKGGEIDRKSFIPTDAARSGNSPNKLVKPNARLKAINKIVNAKNAIGKNNKVKFIKSVVFAGVGGFVLSVFKDKQFLWRVNSLKRDDEGRFKLTALYSFKPNRKVKVEGTGFMKEATMQTAKKMNDFYIKQAKRQIEKYYK